MAGGAKEPERKGRVEVRYKKNGSVDEVLIFEEDGRLLFHLEETDVGRYWARVYAGSTSSDPGKDLILDILSHQGIRVNGRWE